MIEEHIPQVLTRLQLFLDERQIKTYLVGGFVRDSLLHRNTADIDIAITADALITGRLLADELGGKFVPLDETNKISRVVLTGLGENSAAPQLYIDLSTITSDIQGDLARRDFSIDAMAIELKDYLERPDNPPIIDPYHGQDDLSSGLIKALNEEVFKSDPARILRAFRLAAELGFTFTKQTECLIKRDGAELFRVAGERLREELLKLLAASQAGPMVRYMDDLGVLTILIPELEAARGVDQPREHHWDVFNHSLESVSAAAFILREGRCAFIPPEILDEIPWSESLADHFKRPVSNNVSHAVLIKLAALLHDVAKPETKIIDKERVRFFGHNEQGADTVVKIMERLRFSNKETKLVECMVRYHMRPTQMSRNGMPSKRAVYRYFRDTGTAGIDTLFLSLADHLAARGPDLDAEQWLWHIGQVKYILGEYNKDKTLTQPPKLINGHDLMNDLGLSPGPQLRKILEAVREAQASGELSNRDEALSYIKNRLLYKKQN
jgi:poly(A) polymerase